jgi:TRAP-type uncharacterized transport system substrate-binding protein
MIFRRLGRVSMRFDGRTRQALPVLGLWILALVSPLLTSSLALCETLSREPTRLAAHIPDVDAQWKTKLNANTVSIIAGSPDETYLNITQDLAVVLNDDDLRVLPIVGMGGAQNIRDVLYLKGVDIGITSTHMLRYFASTGELGASLDQRLTYISRMFLEEMHVVAGPEIKTLEDLSGKKVNFSDPGSSTQITARDVLGLLSIAVVEVNMSQADAIAKVKSGELAATVVFSGKPAGVFSRISDADNLHLLEVPYTRTLENTYLPAQLESTLYPSLIAKGTTVQTIAVDAVLITNNWASTSERYRRVAKFVDSFFSRFGQLRKPPRHSKWLEVELGTELPGWQRLPAAQAWLDRADQGQTATKRASFEQFLSSKQAGAMPEAEKARLFREFLEWSAREGNNR